MRSSIWLLPVSSLSVLREAAECFGYLLALAAVSMYVRWDGRAAWASELRLTASMLSSLRNGSRRHTAFMPDIAALHCSIELKLQLLVKLRSSLQYSPARAAVGAPSATAATNGAAGMVIAFNTAVVT